jgi:hypothetical protein
VTFLLVKEVYPEKLKKRKKKTAQNILTCALNRFVFSSEALLLTTQTEQPSTGLPPHAVPSCGAGR